MLRSYYVDWRILAMVASLYKGFLGTCAISLLLAKFFEWRKANIELFGTLALEIDSCRFAV